MLPALQPDILIGDFSVISEPYRPGIYLILFTIILLENGIPPMIWLPGDSLLFLTGILAAGGVFDLPTLFIACSLGAFCGYQISYLLGSHIGLPLITPAFFFYHKWGKTEKKWRVLCQVGKCCYHHRTVFSGNQNDGSVPCRNQYNEYQAFYCLQYTWCHALASRCLWIGIPLRSSSLVL